MVQPVLYRVAARLSLSFLAPTQGRQQWHATPKFAVRADDYRLQRLPKMAAPRLVLLAWCVGMANALLLTLGLSTEHMHWKNTFTSALPNPDIPRTDYLCPPTWPSHRPALRPNPAVQHVAQHAAAHRRLRVFHWNHGMPLRQLGHGRGCEREFPYD